MPARNYLPSAKLISIVASLALSAGLVFAADYVTHKTAPAVSVETSTGSTPEANTDWEAALAAAQAQNPSAFETPDPNLVGKLLEEAQSPNITDTIGKTLLINLTSAKSQGLGSDIPTQDQIVAAAAAQLKSAQTSHDPYTAADLTILPVSDSALRAYGNGFITVLGANQNASERATLLAIDLAVEGNDTDQLKTLSTIGVAYASIARSLARLPVPQTLVPLHLQAVNDFLRISATYDDMQTIVADPLRGLAGLQTYESLMDKEARVFINIAQNLSKGGILFSKDEPGNAWAGFLSP